MEAIELYERSAGDGREDYDAFVRAAAELGIEGAPPPHEVFACHVAPYAFFLETAAGELAAYALCRGYGKRGDVRQIVVMPAFRRRGVGTRLLAKVAERLRRAGCSDWRLEVRSDNAAGDDPNAVPLYPTLYMRPDPVVKENLAEMRQAMASRTKPTRRPTTQAASTSQPTTQP